MGEIADFAGLKCTYISSALLISSALIIGSSEFNRAKKATKGDRTQIGLSLF